MIRFLVKRLIQAFVVLVGVTMLVFALVFLSGDPVTALLGFGATQEEAEALRRSLGLDQPLPVQYIRFLGGAVVGDFGQSILYRQPALGLVLERLPATLYLSGAAFVIGMGIAVPLALMSGSKPGTAIDRAATGFVVLAQSIPTFWLGIMLIIIFAVQLRLLPAGGAGTIGHLILPATTLGIYIAPFVARVLRSSLIEQSSRDYVRTARGKGLSSRATLSRHILRNAALPTVTIVGLQLGNLLGGAVITEAVFGYPGMGRLAVNAFIARDLLLVQAFVTVVAIIIIGVNLLADLSYAWLDPRVRLDR